MKCFLLRRNRHVCLEALSALVKRSLIVVDKEEHPKLVQCVLEGVHNGAGKFAANFGLVGVVLFCKASCRLSLNSLYLV